MVRVSRREQTRRRLKSLRASVSVSQRAMSARTGISESRYWRIENGYDQPTFEECEALAKVLRVETSALGFDQVTTVAPPTTTEASQ